MEMCYTGDLVMPNNFVAIATDEMEYIDGGKLSWSTARDVTLVAIGFLVGKIADKVIEKSAIQYVVNAIGGWISNAIDTAVLTVMYYPGKVAATAAAIAILGGVTYGVYRYGRSKGKW